MLLDKPTLRRDLRVLSRTALTEDLRAEGSASVVAQLLAHPLWHQAQRVGLYMALPDEPNLAEILSAPTDKELCLPRVLDEETMAFYRYLPEAELERSASFGLLEPSLSAEEVDPSTIDLLVIPALAYDSSGYRLGRGKGYYDRYLARTKARRLGVTFGLKRLANLPHDPWDLPVDEVLYPIPALL